MDVRLMLHRERPLAGGKPYSTDQLLKYPLRAVP
jgi:hypothetical protein